MGRKLDLSGLSDNEAEHVLQVVQRDMRLRKKEEERLSELKQELDEEGSRCLLLSRQRCFNQRCCIRCCAPFSFLLNPKRQCHDCLYNVCKACRLYSKHDKAWLCCACQKSRLLKQQSLEWFYAHVKGRFKRFGSAKVLKTIYRRHLVEHSALSELTEGSTYEESICNEGSVCGSDATFYRQTEEHSMAETLTVAFRVAEEAIDEAICNAEFDIASQENENEAHYLREHRGELIEELAKTIMQKIISRRKTLTDMRDEYEHDRELEHLGLHHRGDQASITFNHLKGLWRSQSAFSLMDDNIPKGLTQDAHQTLPKESSGSAVTSWTSVDRLENSGVSSVLKSPDGNWIALQSGQLSRPSLLAKRKSLVYSALERESGAVSAYEGMDSDNEAKPELDTSWGAILQEFHRKLTGSKVKHEPDNRARSDSEGQLKKSPLDVFRKQAPTEMKRPPLSCRTTVIDVNFNMKAEESGAASEVLAGKAKRSRKKRSKRRATLPGPLLDHNRRDGQSRSPSDAESPDTLTPEAITPNPLDQKSDTLEHGTHQVDQELTIDGHQDEGHVSDSLLRDEAKDDDDDEAQEVEMRNKEEEDGSMAVDGVRAEEVEEEEVKSRLYKLVAQSRLSYFSSTDDELDRAGRSEDDGGYDEGQEEEESEEKTGGLTHKICQLEEEVQASMLSSTEDELDRVTDEEKKEAEEEEEEELAVKVCRLATEVGAAQFSSTEDELDREDVIHEETLWRLQEDKAAQAAQVRHLASLVSASQFSSTEDELDRVGEDEAEMKQGGEGQESASEELSEDLECWESWESMGDVEAEMFDLRKQNEEHAPERMTENVQDCQDQHGEVDIEESDDRMFEDKDEMVFASHKDARWSEQTVIGQEHPPEVKMSDQRGEEGQEEEQDILGGGENSLETQWEMASASGDEDAEFDRIINSMLMMTLEDMQKLDQQSKDAKTDKEWNKDTSETTKKRDEDMKTDKDSNGDARMADEKEYDTNANEERKEDTDTDMKTKGDLKTDDERKGDTKTEQSRNEYPKMEQDRNKNAETQEWKENVKTDSDSNKIAKGEEKNEDETSKGRNKDMKTDAEKEEHSKTVDEDKQTDIEKHKDAKINTERKDNTKTCKDGNKDKKKDDERKEDTKTSERKNEDVKAEKDRHTDPKTDKEHKGLADRQDKEKLDNAKTENKKKEDIKTDMDRSMDEKSNNEDRKTDETQDAKEVQVDHTSLLEDPNAQTFGDYCKAHESADLSLSRPSSPLTDNKDTGQVDSKMSPDCPTVEDKEDIEDVEEGFLSPEDIRNKYSAASLCSITTEVLKVLNATEELLQGVEGRDSRRPSTSFLPANADPKKLDQHFSSLEEKVYVAAGSVYGVEAELSELEERARDVSSATSNMELSFLEEQVASAAARVHQSELQVNDISARIAALQSAGLNVDPQSRVAKTRTVPVMPLTLSSSRQLRRRLPALPRRDNTKEMIIDPRTREKEPHKPLFIDETEVERVKTFKFLGTHISEDLTWSHNTQQVIKKSQRRTS
ncbi:rab effector MyRIP isoform X2 [Dunckerocampus dactyliophorus]|uniref:rab effector MyRIP isoform X2 n=1 Tax=Dunckerocampus dactyliophorus TaxID=161453 RepID=UPI0024066325|nr:rab effector MyRIP isoform X2 [Dunckerocampus dactyliophorus]